MERNFIIRRDKHCANYLFIKIEDIFTLLGHMFSAKPENVPYK